MSSAFPARSTVAPSSSETASAVEKSQDATAEAPSSTSRDVNATVAAAEPVKLEGIEDPRNWTPLTKWSITCVLSLLGFVSPLGSSIIIAGARGIDMSFHLKSRVLSLLPMSLFMLGLGFGPLFMAPLSELKGRKPVYVTTALLFTIFNVATAVAPNYPALLILRFIAGIFGSTGPSLGGGTIGDMFAVRERARAQALYGLGPVLGPVVGNIVGGWIDQSGEKNWRWLLWTLTILSGVVTAICCISLRETYAPVLLRRKCKRLEKALPSASSLSAQAKVPIRERLHQVTPSKEATTKMKHALTRPFRLLFTNPICAIMSCYLGFCYGLIFLFLVQHPLLYERRNDPEQPSPDELPTYNWTPGLAGMTFVGLAIGFLFATAFVAAYQNRIYEALSERQGVISFVPGWVMGKGKNNSGGNKQHAIDTEREAGVDTLPKAEAMVTPPAINAAPKKGEPEYRLPLCLLGMFVFPIGLLLFGWAGENRLHWVVPLAGSLLVGAGTITCFQAILVYLVDAFIPYSASAVACAVLVRSVLAATLPLIAGSLYRDLGFGWGSTLLAFIGLAGVPVPIILFRYGGPLRRRFKFSG